MPFTLLTSFKCSRNLTFLVQSCIPGQCLRSSPWKLDLAIKHFLVMFQLSQKFLVTLRWPPAMLTFCLLLPLLQHRMLHGKKSPLLSRVSGQKSQELISESFLPAKRTPAKAELLQGAVSLLLGLCMDYASLSKYSALSPQSRGKHSKFREILILSCRMWGSPMQTETDGKGGNTPQSVSLSPLHSLPLQKYWVTFAFSLCVHTSLSMQPLTHSCYRLPGPPSATASSGKGRVPGLKASVKSPLRAHWKPLNQSSGFEGLGARKAHTDTAIQHSPSCRQGKRSAVPHMLMGWWKSCSIASIDLHAMERSLTPEAVEIQWIQGWKTHWGTPDTPPWQRAAGKEWYKPKLRETRYWVISPVLTLA